MFELIAVGADPEVFLKTNEGRSRSAEGIIGGTKDEPKAIPKMRGFYVQEDNVAAEFNIPPAANAVSFSENIAKALNYLEKVATQKKLSLDIASARHFSMEELMTPHAMLLGCDPDFCAWTQERNPSPRPPKTLRTAAGHVHISWSSPDDPQRWLVGKACDIYLGLPSILATQQNERRQLYGKAGAVRLKPYGLEYRTLDNFWIKTDENRRHVFQSVREMMGKLSNHADMIAEAAAEYSIDIRMAIDFHDQDKAIELCSLFDVNPFPVHE